MPDDPIAEYRALLDGWYWVKWPRWSQGATDTVPGMWAVAVYDAANDEWIDQGLHRRHPPMKIGPRIPSPDEAQEYERRLVDVASRKALQNIVISPEVDTCPDCGLEDHPHQTCEEANMTDEELIRAMNARIADAPR